MIKTSQPQKSEPQMSRRRLLKWGATVFGAAAPVMISLTPSKARAYGSWSSDGLGSGETYGNPSGGMGDMGSTGSGAGGFGDATGMASDAQVGQGLAHVAPDWSVGEERQLQALRSSWQMPGGYGWRQLRTLEQKRARVSSRYYVGFNDQQF